MRNEFLKIISIGIAVMGFSIVESRAQNKVNQTTVHLERTEMQHFEQSYEAWVQGIVHQVLPKTNLTVLTEFNYSSSPEQIQTYEEHRAANHLPGLPEVTDISNAHPTENPIYELISQQNIKLIFDEQPTDDQIRVLKEMLIVKLNLDTSHGDQLSFDHLNRGNNYLGKLAVSFSKNKKINLILMLLAAIAATVVAVVRNKKSSANKELGENEISHYYNKLNPIEIVLKTEPKFLISLIRKQETNFLVQIMAHAPISFNQIILQIFETEEREALFKAFQEQRLSITRKKSKYSQLLLAAKIHDELKIEAIKQVDVLSEVSTKIAEQRMKMNDSLQQLKALYVSTENDQVKSDEVNHEATI